MNGVPLEEYAAELLAKAATFLDEKDDDQALVIAEIMEFIEIINEYPVDGDVLIQ